MKIFYQNRSNILNDVIPRVKMETNLLKAQALLIWNCVVPREKRIVELAKEYGIPSFCYDHGLMGYNDHNKNLKDGVTNKHGEDMIADYYLAWGESAIHDLKGSVPEEKIKVVGCPVLWENEYWYADHKNKKTVKLPAFQGGIIKDPQTKITWEFVEQKTQRVKTDGKGRIILYMPNHSAHYRDRTENTFNQLKDIPNLFTKATNGMANWTDSPFKVYDNDRRHEKIIFIDPQLPVNLTFLHQILKKTKLIITDIPGTAQLLGWSAGIPVIVPKYDWKLRDNDDKILYNTTKADIVCEPDKIKETVESVLDGEIDKSKEMEEMSKYYGGVHLGNPTENILKEINVICLKQ